MWLYSLRLFAHSYVRSLIACTPPHSQFSRHNVQRAHSTHSTQLTLLARSSIRICVRIPVLRVIVPYKPSSCVVWPFVGALFSLTVFDTLLVAVALAVAIDAEPVETQFGFFSFFSTSHDFFRCSLNCCYCWFTRLRIIHERRIVPKMSCRFSTRNYWCMYLENAKNKSIKTICEIAAAAAIVVATTAHRHKILSKTRP